MGRSQRRGVGDGQWTDVCKVKKKEVNRSENIGLAQKQSQSMGAAHSPSQWHNLQPVESGSHPRVCQWMMDKQKVVNLYHGLLFSSKEE